MNGIDVSYAQGLIDWAAVKESGQVDFAYSRATYGLSIIDDQYARNSRVARIRGMPFGAYHFFKPELDPAQQAAFFLSEAGITKGDLVPVIDVETTGGVSNIDQIVSAIATFNQAVETKIGTKVIVYTYYSFWNDTMQGSDAFAGHPLWIAEYNTDAAPTLPNGWADWKMWQHADNGTIPGVTHNVVDLNTSNGALLLVG